MTNEVQKVTAEAANLAAEAPKVVAQVQAAEVQASAELGVVKTFFAAHKTAVVVMLVALAALAFVVGLVL